MGGITLDDLRRQNQESHFVTTMVIEGYHGTGANRRALYVVYRNALLRLEQRDLVTCERAYPVGRGLIPVGATPWYDRRVYLERAAAFATPYSPAFAWEEPWRQHLRPGNSGAWRLVQWTDEDELLVRELVCHESEIADAVLQPYPPGAVAREVVETIPGEPAEDAPFFRTSPIDWCLLPGQSFTVTVNQGERDALVLAASGYERLVEYAMPRGSTALRIIDVRRNPRRDRAISYNHLPLRWLETVVAAGQVWIGRPQGSGKHPLPAPATMLERRRAGQPEEIWPGSM